MKNKDLVNKLIRDLEKDVIATIINTIKPSNDQMKIVRAVREYFNTQIL